MNQIWTPAKLEKAWRIFDKAVGVIADGIDVPSDELRAFLIDGKIPDTVERPSPVAMTLQKRIAQYHEANPLMTCKEVAEALGASYDTVRGLASREGIVWPPRAKPAPKDEGEALLQRFGSKVKFRLRHGAGPYLHMSCSALTNDKQLSWIGSADQLRAVRLKHPVSIGMTPVPVLS